MILVPWTSLSHTLCLTWRNLLIFQFLEMPPVYNKICDFSSISCRNACPKLSCLQLQCSRCIYQWQAILLLLTILCLKLRYLICACTRTNAAGTERERLSAFETYRLHQQKIGWETFFCWHEFDILEKSICFTSKHWPDKSFLNIVSWVLSLEKIMRTVLIFVQWYISDEFALMGGRRCICLLFFSDFWQAKLAEAIFHWRGPSR